MAGITPSRGINLVRINSGTFGALAATAVVNLNLVASNQTATVRHRIPPRLLKGTLRGTIEDLVVYVKNATTKPSLTLNFWANDSQNVTAINTIKLWGVEQVAPGDFSRESAVTTNNIWKGHVGGLAIPYADEDNTGEFHISIENDKTTAIAQGRCRFEFGYRPEYGA